MTLGLTPWSHRSSTSARGVHRTTWRRSLTVQASAALLALTAVVTLPTPARAAEAVADGSFEAATDTYINPWWVRDGDNAYFTTSLARTGSWSGGLRNSLAGNPSPALQQTITIPEGHSATLSYWRSFFYKTADRAPLLVYMDDVVIDTVDNDLQHNWVRETVDLSAFTDGSPHLLRFERTTVGPPVASGGDPQGVLLDDVSVISIPLPRVPAVVVLGYRPGKSLFRGTVHAEQGCAAGRAVALKRVRPGADPTVRRATTGPDGAFSIREDARPGRYYALVKQTARPEVICLATRSVRVRVTD